MAGWVLEGSGRMCLKMGAGRWEMVLFESPARRALFSCSWASWRDGSAKRQAVGAHNFTESREGPSTCRIPVRSDGCAPLLVFLRRQSSVWTQRGWASATHRPALTNSQVIHTLEDSWLRFWSLKVAAEVFRAWVKKEEQKERIGCFHLSFIDSC